MKITSKLIKITYLASGAYLLANGGPCSKTFSAVSAKPNDGIFAF